MISTGMILSEGEIECRMNDAKIKDVFRIVRLSHKKLKPMNEILHRSHGNSCLIIVLWSCLDTA